MVMMGRRPKRILPSHWANLRELSDRRSDDQFRAEFELKNAYLQRISKKKCIFVGAALPQGVFVTQNYYNGQPVMAELECYYSADNRNARLNDGYKCKVGQEFMIQLIFAGMSDLMPYVKLLTNDTNEVVCVRWHVFKSNFIPDMKYWNVHHRVDAYWVKYNDDLEGMLSRYRNNYMKLKDQIMMGSGGYGADPYDQRMMMMDTHHGHLTGSDPYQ